MRYRRLLPLVMAGLLVPAMFPGGAAGAQTELDRAGGEVARAKAERDAAQEVVDDWAAQRGTVQARVMAALFALEQTNTRLEDASFRVFELRDEILEAEARLRHLRETTESRVIETYMIGTGGGLFSIWSASNFEQSALLEETAAAAQRAESLQLVDLATERDRLRSLQSGYQEAQEQLRTLREDNVGQRDMLEDLFLEVDARYAQSYAGLQQADAGYQQALGVWDAAQRRRAARAGVEPWRSLIEQYFPADRAEEALRVMACESGGNADAVHPESDATGLFQFLAGTWVFSSVNAGFAGASRFDAEANVAAAAWLVEYSILSGHPRGAWGHWVCQP
ncbi:MAG: transglycosylase SLT domain-containing protein [Acidimicrobiia bacterium]|nr:transglycosylase SLT domain-containing protein [Acidimicrobiia bacterium]